MTASDDQARPSQGEFIDVEGERYFAIDDVDALAPFLIAVPSAGDQWLFASSNGAFTAGRRSADEALLPYTTDDRVHDSAEHTGGKTILRVGGQVWEPLSIRGEGRHRISRRLAKSVVGNKLRFEEVNHDLGLAYACSYGSSDRFGLVREVTVRNLGPAPCRFAIVDGLQNLLPAGLGRRFQMEFSTLADAYKDSELDPATGLGIFRLASQPADAPEPNEALRATTVFARGLARPTHLLSSAQLAAFRRGQPLVPETRVRGQRMAYFTAGQVDLAVGGHCRLVLAADVGQDATAVVATARLLRSDDPVAAIDADVARGTEALIAIVAAADGLSATADERASTRHFSNVLFNNMRGGLPLAGYELDRGDFARFLAESNRVVAARRAPDLARLPVRFAQRTLLALARELADPAFERLALEYLPFTFSRRHGDPSRPWNRFHIAVKDEAGQPIAAYEGNWRDIFQNWEALALSYPGFALSMIGKFLDASTADGHNPYRVTRQGFEWEVPDPHDPWAFFGYWGDHQVPYLLRLCELAQRHQPGALSELLGRRIFSYADVPYRIAGFADLVRDPRATIRFDEAAHARALARAATLGGEGKCLPGSDGEPARASLTEKLLLVLLARLGNFVPEAGLWLNTQRPEWNDAQNALVGAGASMVTVYHLRRLLGFVRALFAPETGSFAVAVEIAGLLTALVDALGQHAPSKVGYDDGARLAALTAFGTAMARYRERIYAHGFSGLTVPVSGADVGELCDVALRHVDHAIARNRREDGLYHAYNLLGFSAGGIGLRRLPLMLEGQVAALGVLGAPAAADLLDALAKSALYRADQRSYVLYPDRVLPGFLARNVLPEADVRASGLLTTLLERRDRRLVVRDESGDVHFAADLRNARALGQRLDELAEQSDLSEDGTLAALVAGERAALLALYERVFDHQAFTGRAGSFYKYEGLGCIYWHMNSKLLVAAQECIDRLTPGAPAGLRARLEAHVELIHAGLGLHKPPAVHGALPTDPYSHTPGHAGAQQPGLTGQVKEDIIARARTLGVVVEAGTIRFDPLQPGLLAANELLRAPARFGYRDVTGARKELALGAGSLAFTLCQVPVVYRDTATDARIVVHYNDGVAEIVPGLRLAAAQASALWQRTNQIRLVEVQLALTTPKV